MSYKNLENPITGEKIRFLKTSRETKGEYFRFELILKPNGYMPFAHRHPHQVEVFEVLEGELRIVIDGKQHQVKAGESIEVPKGAVHQPHNGSDQDMKAIITVSPALNTSSIMRIVCGLAKDGYVNAKGRPGFLRMATIADTYPDEGYMPTTPIFIQRIASKVGGTIGWILGYRRHQQKYLNALD